MKRALLLGNCLLFLLCATRRAPGQNVLASTNPERKGSGDLSVSYQNYYNRVNGKSAANVQGASVSLRHFFPRSGLFNLHLEPVTNGGNFSLGENFAQWSGLPWANRHWDLAAGDFRATTAMIENPFPNLSQPEVSFRGARVIARTDHWTYSVYGGKETLSQGSRVSNRANVPQSALGAEATAAVSSRVQLGFRYLHLASPIGRVQNDSLFFPINRGFTSSDSLTSQTSVRISKALAWYTETGWSRLTEPGNSQARPRQFSIASGPELITTRVTIRANYLNQGTGYLPVLGYYLGDRRGANAEGVLYLGRLSFSGNWGQARNNRERNPVVPNYFSRQGSGGFQLRLPSNVFLSGSTSRLHFETQSTESGVLRNDNRQYLLMISRPLFRHNIHATWQRLDSVIRDSNQRLQYLELEDNYNWKRLSIGGAARLQQFDTEQLRQSLFLRASGQYQTRKLSVYGYWEQGKDLASETLLSTQISSTSVVGFTWQAPKSVTFKMEGFRNHLNTVLNPENLFVLGSRGIAPDNVLSRSDDWSLYLRVSREFSWGEPGTLGGGGLRQPEAPLTGTLAGYVRLQAMTGVSGVGEVWLVTDTGQAVKTDSTGYFQVPDVPQGGRIVKLDLDRLPADLNPPAQEGISVEVRSGQLTRADLQVTPLEAIEGVVIGDDGEPAGEGIVVRLSPADTYTLTDTAGRFGFYNLPEGDYEVRLTESSLPENAVLDSAPVYPAILRYGKSADPITFQYSIVLPGPKPTRNVFSGRQSAAVAPGAARPKSNSSKGRRIIGTTAQNISTRSARPPARPPAKKSQPQPVRKSNKWVAR